MGAGASLQEAPSPGWHALAEMAEAADKPDVVAKLVREHQIDPPLPSSSMTKTCASS